MSTFELYILLVLPQIREALLTMSVLAAVGVGVAAFVFTLSSYVGFSYGDDDGSNALKARATGFKLWRILGWLSLPVLAAVVMPSTKIMLALIGWELGTSIEGIENIPANLVDYMNTLIEAEIGELATGAAEAVDAVESAAGAVESAAGAVESAVDAVQQ